MEYLVDGWAICEQNRLNYIRRNPQKLRMEQYSDLASAAEQNPQLDLNQPEEQGKCGGKVASSKTGDDDEWAATVTTTEDPDPPYKMANSDIKWPKEEGAGAGVHTPYLKTSAWEYYPERCLIETMHFYNNYSIVCHPFCAINFI
jgi:hypothetical protein